MTAILSHFFPVKLSAKRQVTVRDFRGAVLIDIREYYDDQGVSKPGKKGTIWYITSSGNASDTD